MSVTPRAIKPEVEHLVADAHAEASFEYLDEVHKRRQEVRLKKPRMAFVMQARPMLVR